MQRMNFDQTLLKKKKSYKRHFGGLGGNLNMDWILDNIFKL